MHDGLLTNPMLFPLASQEEAFTALQLKSSYVLSVKPVALFGTIIRLLCQSAG